MFEIFGPGYDKRSYGYVNQNLAHIASVKYYLLKTFREYLKHLSLILTNI